MHSLGPLAVARCVHALRTATTTILTLIIYDLWIMAMFTGLRMLQVITITMLFLRGPIQSHNPGLHPRVQTLRPRSA